jgi:hypothetical protein
MYNVRVLAPIADTESLEIQETLITVLQTHILRLIQLIFAFTKRRGFLGLPEKVVGGASG